MFDIPILFLVFNRPDLTKRVFEKIKLVKPSKLYVGADGPRDNKEEDAILCEQTRQIILKGIDWNCDVKLMFRDSNLGCRCAVTEAIDWFFKDVEYGIILEDDTLPELSFFNYCAELLELYVHAEHIFHISGNNFQLSNVNNGSYYLSKIPHIWGWATWRRAWNKFDAKLQMFDLTDNNIYFNDEEIDLYWSKQFERVKNLSVDEWDYQWTYALFRYNGYAIQPQYNLVKNIGFDNRSSRTSSATDFLADLKIYSIDTIIHPSDLTYNKTADINFQKFFNWYLPLYHNRLSGSQALKTLLKISKKKIRRILD